MRRIFILILIFSFYKFSIGQPRSKVIWLDGSIKAGYGNSYFFNYNTASDPNISMYKINTGNVIGGRIGVTFSNEIGISVEVLSNTLRQRYHVKPLSEATYIKKVKLNCLDIGLMGRFATQSGFYFELGPRFATIMKASESNSPPYPGKDDISYHYTTKLIKGFSGGAGLILFSSYDDRHRFSLGGRITYFTDDVMAAPNFPPTSDEFYPITYRKEYPTYPFEILIMAEYTYFFGYYGRSGCGKSKFVVFKKSKRYF